MLTWIRRKDMMQFKTWKSDGDDGFREHATNCESSGKDKGATPRAVWGDAWRFAACLFILTTGLATLMTAGCISADNAIDGADNAGGVGDRRVEKLDVLPDRVVRNGHLRMALLAGVGDDFTDGCHGRGPA